MFFWSDDKNDEDKKVENKKARENVDKDEIDDSENPERVKAEEESKQKEDQRVKAEEEAKKKEDQKNKAEEEAKQKEDQKNKAEEEAKQKEDQKNKAEEEAKQKEDQKNKAEEEAKQKEDERMKAEEEAKKLEDERLKAEVEAKKKEDERLKVEVEAKKKEDERLKAEVEAKKLELDKKTADEEAKKLKDERLKAEEEAKKLEQEKKTADEEAKKKEDERLKAEEEAKKLEQEKKTADEEAKKKEDESKKADEEARKLEDESRKADDNLQQKTDEKDKADDNLKQKEEEKNRVDDNLAYGFKPSEEKHHRVKSGFLASVAKLVASPPIIVSTFSFTHLIRRLSLYQMIFSIFCISLHYIFSYFVISRLMDTKDTQSISESYGSLDDEGSPFLSLLVDFFLIILKFITCLFFIDMLLESVSVSFGLRLDSVESVFWKYFIMFLLTLLLSIGYALYRQYEILGTAVDFILVGVSFTITLLLWIVKDGTPSSEPSHSSSWLTTAFLIFSFISFSYECTSCSISVHSSTKSSLFLVSVASVCILSLFFMSFLYFSKWLWDMRLSEILSVLDSKSRVISYLMVIYAVLGFLLNVNTLNNSLVNIFSILVVLSNKLGTVLFLLVTWSLIFLVVWSEIGRFLWWSIMIIFLGLPLYAMFPYLVKRDLISFILVGVFSVFLINSVINIRILDPDHIPV